MTDELVVYLAGPFHDRCKELIAEGKVNPHVTPRDVRNIDSVGMGLSIGLSTHCKANGGSIKITNATESVSEIMLAQQLGDFLYA